MPREIITKLREQLIFPNPQWEENNRRGYSNWNTPERLYFIDEHDDVVVMPRGFISQLKRIFHYFHVPLSIDDQTRMLKEVSFTFNGQLHSYQEEAVKRMFPKRFGVLQAPTGSGKTVIALYLIAQRRQPSLVIVHTKELMYQWQEKAVEFLDLTMEEIGLIGDGNKTVGERLTIAIINSLYKSAHTVKDQIGFLILDECHRTPARTFTEAVIQFDSAYMAGLSATPYRRDKLTKLIYVHAGDKLHEIKPRKLQQEKKIMSASLKVRETDFDYSYDDDYHDMISALVGDIPRNALIVNDIIVQVNNDNGIALVISDRKSHCQHLYTLLEAQNIEARLLTGDKSNKERKTIISELNQGHVKTLVATTQLIGEGFDLKILSSLFLTTPIRFTGKLKQAVGRILRTAKDKKKAIVYDYVDKSGILQSSFRSRLSAYRELNIPYDNDKIRELFR